MPNVPLHETPLLASEYPVLQPQVRDPVVSVHVCAQPPLLVLHSFTSVHKNIKSEIVHAVVPFPRIYKSTVIVH